MERAVPLGPEDRAILDLEGPTIAGHTCKVVVVEAGEADVDALRAEIGSRLGGVPQLTWLLGGSDHDPRSIVDWSLMPGFPFLFEEKAPGDVRADDRVVTIPGPRAPRGVVVVAKPEAIALVDYLISLKRQYPVTDSVGGRMRTASGGRADAH